VGEKSIKIKPEKQSLGLAVEIEELLMTKGRRAE
jgi:hypothetical protein